MSIKQKNNFENDWKISKLIYVALVFFQNNILTNHREIKNKKYTDQINQRQARLVNVLSDFCQRNRVLLAVGQNWPSPIAVK